MCCSTTLVLYISLYDLLLIFQSFQTLSVWLAMSVYVCVIGCDIHMATSYMHMITKCVLLHLVDPHFDHYFDEPIGLI